MGRTSIEWTSTVNPDGSVTLGKTWNPVRGCSHVSEGCRRCYAERQAARYSGPGLPFEGFAHRGVVAMSTTGGEAGKKYTRWTGRVELVPGRGNERHLYPPGSGDVSNRRRWPGWPLPNVWLGVSVEDQATAFRRIPDLIATPAAKRFISVEPMLEAIDFTDGPADPDSTMGPWSVLDELDWVIVGGESGPGARTFEISWARSVLAQCRAAGVPAFVKQLGSNSVATGPRLKSAKGGDPAEWPEDLRVREFPR